MLLTEDTDRSSLTTATDLVHLITTARTGIVTSVFVSIFTSNINYIERFDQVVVYNFITKLL